MEPLTHLQHRAVTAVRRLDRTVRLGLLALAGVIAIVAPATALDRCPAPQSAEALALVTTQLSAPDPASPFQLQFRYESAPRFTAQILGAIQTTRCMATITVLDEHRRPVAGVEVIAGDLFIEIHARSDAQGSCRIPVYKGQWSIRVEDQGFLNGETDIEVGESQADVQLTHAVHSADAFIAGTIEGDL
jgi:hypothetical protein